MKKILSTLLLTSLLALPVMALAQAVPPEISITDAIYRVTNWLFAILMSLAAVFLIYGGVLFVTASGNEEQIAKARKTLTYALIGVAVALLARGAVTFLRTVIEG
jgi:threonine/homoserine/homoserine lactone efflux protein